MQVCPGVLSEQWRSESDVSIAGQQSFQQIFKDASECVIRKARKGVYMYSLLLNTPLLPDRRHRAVPDSDLTDPR